MITLVEREHEEKEKMEKRRKAQAGLTAGGGNMVGTVGSGGAVGTQITGQYGVGISSSNNIVSMVGGGGGGVGAAVGNVLSATPIATAVAVQQPTTVLADKQAPAGILTNVSQQKAVAQKRKADTPTALIVDVDANNSAAKKKKK